MIEVRKAGFYSSIQDLGRYGYRDLGIPYSGVMDSYSAKMVNLHLGNTENAAVIELTMIGASFYFNESSVIAVCGANMSPKLNGETLKMNSPVSIPKGSLLEFGMAISGFRTYLGIQGGVMTKMVLGSRSYYESITKRTQLKVGDNLEIGNCAGFAMSSLSKLKYNSDVIDGRVLNARKGPEFGLLPIECQEKVKKSQFVISDKHSRMGYQLVPEIGKHNHSILTSPVLPGTVQWTPSGQLIVLMRDSQTTGGYPRILQLNEKSINTLAQKRTGDKVNFEDF